MGRWLMAVAGLALVAASIGLLVWSAIGPRLMAPLVPSTSEDEQPRRRYSVAERVAEIAPAARPRLEARFAAAAIPYPPASVRLVALKAEKSLDLYAQAGNGWRLVHRYPVLAASGGPGPKLKEGDRQVPEGVYRISALNPNSRFHVSLRVDYPNDFDRARAAEEGRTNLGGDIMIHGNAVSIGCLAMGDPAAEEFFVLAADAGLPALELVIAPNDTRAGPADVPDNPPAWLPTVHRLVAEKLAELPKG